MQINKESECEVVKNRLVMNQEAFIKHFNAKGEKMISVPDIYKIAKEENKGLIDSLVKDFKDRWVVTSTRIIYDKEGFAEIIHDVDSVVVKPKSIIVDAPYIQGKAEYSKELEKYLQALFGTEDCFQDIISVLKRFDKDKTLHVWTPDESSRKSRKARALRLDFNDFVRFDVNGVNWIDVGNGFSREVLVKSAKRTNKKRGDRYE